MIADVGGCCSAFDVRVKVGTAVQHWMHSPRVEQSVRRAATEMNTISLVMMVMTVIGLAMRSLCLEMAITTQMKCLVPILSFRTPRQAARNSLYAHPHVSLL